MSEQSDVWDAVLRILEDKYRFKTEQLDLPDTDSKVVKQTLYEIADRGWLDRDERRGEWEKTHSFESFIGQECYGPERHAYDYGDTADRHREHGEFRLAGHWYTRAAYARLGNSEHIPLGAGSPGSAIQTLATAALCYRLAGDVPNRKRVCTIGELVADTVLEWIDSKSAEETFWTHPPWLGVWHEWRGDLRIHAGRDDADEAYQVAYEIYVEMSRDIWPDDQANARLFSHFNDLVSTTGAEIDTWRWHYDAGSYTEWMEYKWEHLPRLVEALDELGATDIS